MTFGIDIASPQRDIDLARAKAEGVERVEVQLVWSPRWDKGRMSEVALLELGLL